MDLEDPNRWSVNLGAAMWRDPIQDVGRPGLLVQAGRTLWVGPAWGNAFQFSARAHGVLGVTSEHGLLATGLTGGFEFGLLSLLSLEVQIGPGAMGSLGTAGAAFSAGMFGTGAWCLHPFEDQRQKLTLGILMTPMFTVTSNAPETDCPLCASLGASLGYEGMW